MVLYYCKNGWCPVIYSLEWSSVVEELNEFFRPEVRSWMKSGFRRKDLETTEQFHNNCLMKFSK